MVLHAHSDRSVRIHSVPAQDFAWPNPNAGQSTFIGLTGASRQNHKSRIVIPLNVEKGDTPPPANTNPHIAKG